MKNLIWTILTFVAVFAIVGCVRLPQIKLPDGTKLLGMKGQGEPAKVEQNDENVQMHIPEGSEVFMSESSGTEQAPVLKMWSFKLSKPTDFMAQVKQIQASTGNVNTDVALAEVKAKERKWYMWGGIGFIAVGIVLAVNPYLKWPLGGWSFVGAGVLLLFAHMNPTFFTVAVAVACVGAGLIGGGELMERMTKRAKEQTNE